MKISRGIRDIYSDVHPKYLELQKRVDNLLISKKEKRWHYESRIKREESFALKLETGRFQVDECLGDFFACTIVVENHARIAAAEELIKQLFTVVKRRPENDAETHLNPENFGFDDLRLYTTWRDDPARPPSGINDKPFEIQIKTFLQHAWGIATHDFVYKSDDVDWAESRIAYQVKAMLEHAELSISEASKLSDAKILGRCNHSHSELRSTIQAIKKRWKVEQLPTDLKRLAENIVHLSRNLGIRLDDLWIAVDGATESGDGAESVNLSPYAATLAAIVKARGTGVFDVLRKDRKKQIYVPDEIEIPELAPDITRMMVRPFKTTSTVPPSFEPSP